MSQQPLKLKDALEIVNRQDAFGRFLPFQIAFYTMGKGLQNFKRIELPQATRCIVPVAHRANKNLIGVRPVVLGKHEYSVHRRLIVEINRQPIVP